MEFDTAKEILRKHDGQGDSLADSLVGNLRPYTGGISDTHLVEIIEALFTVAPVFQNSNVDREVVHDVWDMCRTARCWSEGPHEPSFHGKNSISVEDKRKLDEWLYIVESATLSMLRGLTVDEVFAGMHEPLRRYGMLKDVYFLHGVFANALISSLESGANADVEDQVGWCHALGMAKSASVEAANALAETSRRALSAQVRHAAASALTLLQKID